MTHDPREALEQIQAVCIDNVDVERKDLALRFIRNVAEQALTASAPKGEDAKPVAWMFPRRWGFGVQFPKPTDCTDEDGNPCEPTPLYTSPPPAAGCAGPRWRHKKRGTTYTEIGRGTLQVAAETCLQDDEPVVIYRSDDDGSLWARPVGEFEDGRFAALHREAPASSGEADETWSASKHDEIIKRLMAQAGVPNSTSLYTAFKQFANELHALSARPEKWECMGRKQSLPEPGECDWPDCGCDPYATKVIESLVEQGWSAPARPDAGGEVRDGFRHSSMAAQWTYDPEAEAYYFAPMTAAPGPYLKQRHVDAIIDIAADGTLAGVELIDNMPPPPIKALSTPPDAGKALIEAREGCRHGRWDCPDCDKDWAVADEAKKPEGGTEGRAVLQHARLADTSLSVSGSSEIEAGIESGPSEPSPPPDRREIVARIIDPDAYNGSAGHRDMYARRATAITKADRILVQDEAAIRADEREQCAIVAETCTVKRHWQPEIAAAIRDRLAALDGGR